MAGNQSLVRSMTKPLSDAPKDELLSQMNNFVVARRDGTGHPDLLLPVLAARLDTAIAGENNEQQAIWLKAFRDNMANASWRYLDEILGLLEPKNK